MNWIRIAVKMKADPRLGAIAADCRVRVEHAVGLVACVLMEFPDHARSGDVAAVPDVVLEQWAMWAGKPGVFAASFRTHLCDETGVVRAWEKFNGAALRKADADIARKRAARERRTDGAQTARAVPAPSVRRNAARRQNGEVDETRRDVTSSSTGVDDDVAPLAPSSAADRTALLRHFTDPTHRDAVVGYLRSAQFPEAVAAHLATALDPNGGGSTPQQVGQAMHEMRLNGVPAFRSAVFAGFLRRVKTAPAELADAPLTDPTRGQEYFAAVRFAREGDTEWQQVCRDNGWTWEDAA